MPPNDEPDARIDTHRPRGWRGQVAVFVGLLAVVLIAHGASLWDGLFFDDYWHRVTLRSYGWGFHDLIESATFDLPGRLTHLWWQTQPLQWRYSRAVAMFFMKLEYHLTGGSPVGVHACSLLWHLLTAMLIYRLATWAGLARGWSFLAGAMFLLNPHSVFAISWVAARNAQVSALFFVAAVAAYGSASLGRDATPSPLRAVRLAGCVVLWLLALFARESAVVFPAVAIVLDAAFGGRRHCVRRLGVHAVFVLIAAGYVFWRLRIFPNADVPNIYFSSPAGLAYAAWAASKLLQMVFATVFYTPMFLGIATYGGFADGQLLVHAVMLVLVGLIAVWYAWASRGRRDRWVWPAWLIVGYLPVIPVFITPHFSLLPFGAWAITIPVGLSRLPRRWRAGVTVLVIAATVWSLGVYRVLWRGIVRSEQLIYADVLSTAPPPPPGTKLLFVNLPIAGIYAPVALRELWGVDDLEGYVLTFAPHPLMMTEPSEVKRLNDRELEVAIPAPGYFSGLSGRMLLDGMRPGQPLTPGTVVRGDLFDTTVLEADEAGVRRLRFTFHRPVDDEGLRIYVSSPQRPACLVRFGMSKDDLAAETGAWQADHADVLAERERYFTIDRFARRFVRSDLYLTGKR